MKVKRRDGLEDGVKRHIGVAITGASGESVALVDGVGSCVALVVVCASIDAGRLVGAVNG